MEKKTFSLPSAEEIIQLCGIRNFKANNIKSALEILKSHGILKTADDEKMFVTLQLCADRPGLEYKPGSINAHKMYDLTNTNIRAIIVIPQAFKSFGQAIDDLAFNITKAFIENKDLQNQLSHDFDINYNYTPIGTYSIKDIVENYNKCLKNAEIFKCIDFEKNTLPKWLEQTRLAALDRTNQRLTSNNHNIRDLNTNIEIAKIKADVYERKLEKIKDDKQYDKAYAVLSDELQKENDKINVYSQRLQNIKTENTDFSYNQQLFSVTPHDYLLQQMGYDVEDEGAHN